MVVLAARMSSVASLALFTATCSCCACDAICRACRSLIARSSAICASRLDVSAEGATAVAAVRSRDSRSPTRDCNDVACVRQCQGLLITSGTASPAVRAPEATGLAPGNIRQTLLPIGWGVRSMRVVVAAG
eukprot:6183691-Pleurochrysis_carterae.AAC.1